MGTFFDSELHFDACDGDERKEKTNAYSSMLDAQDLLEKVEEIPDETILQFESYEDFVEVMKPKKNLIELKSFLQENNFTLNANRRINIFNVKKS